MNAPLFAEFDNSYARLPERFYARHSPTAVAAPELLALNNALADELGLDISRLTTGDGLNVLAGNSLPYGSEPLAMAYAGHQFGSWVPQLGDGRAIMLGEVVTPSGERFDLQLKGAGRTPFSRGGDGRAWLGPVLREYIVSEAMAALGVPTTRALAACATGETVLRESALPGAILTRIAQSHIRVGSFEYFLAREDIEGLKTLADYVIQRHYPDIENTENPYLGLLQAVIDRQSSLIARWMGLGFIHGVMNTDNMTVSGETIDYGPCAFMDTYDPAKVFSSIDQRGRYAYQNQPRVAQWNLAVLAQCLLPLIDENQETAVEVAQSAVDGFSDRYSKDYLITMRGKLGLTESDSDDESLITRLLNLMTQNHADFTHTFHALTGYQTDSSGERVVGDNDQGVPLLTLNSLIGETDDSIQWIEDWTNRRSRQSSSTEEQRQVMGQHNPLYIPRNHQIENVIQAALSGDFTLFQQMLSVVTQPFVPHAGLNAFAAAPSNEEIVMHTFCGT